MAIVTPTVLKRSGLIKPPAAEATQYEHVPMLLPTMTEGKNIVEITTRSKFLKDNIALWRNWHFYRFAAALLAVVGVLALRFSVYFTIAAVIAAAWCYGEHVKANFAINMILKRRDLLWTK